MIALSRTDSPQGWKALLTAYRRVQQTKTENNLAEKARNAVNNSPRLDQVHAVFEELAPTLDGEVSLLAETVGPTGSALAGVAGAPGAAAGGGVSPAAGVWA